MQTVPLKANPRSDNGKGPARQLRARGLIPTVAYGKGTDTEALAVEAQALRSILKSPRGRNSVIELQIEGGSAYPVMLKEYTVHPLRRTLLHADFIRIDEATPVICEVPFRTLGKCVGELEGGTLLTSVRSLRVRCLPGQIPECVEHEVSALRIDDSVRVKELTLPESVEVLMSPEQKLVMVVPPRVLEAAEGEGEAAEGEGAEGEEGAGEGAEGEGGDDSKDKDRGKDRSGR